MSFALADLARRMAQMIRFGTIQSVDLSDPTAPRCVVSDGTWLTPAIPWISARAGGDAEIWAPDQGEQAVVFSPFGDPAQGVALVGIFQMTMPAPAATAGQRVVKYKDGGIESYDRTASKKVISVPAGGSITLQVGTTSLIITQGAVTLNGADVIADSISLKEHVHTGVTRGGSQTDAPTG
ncbi:phage baseplate assembly protein V [Acidocella sp. MX-AZ02]|uniref:phage baseplate assembly protein V n=1 Tax=Acidocella sp. MX-AZ02 TaxID=1214225 RepID=UPI00028CF871|nr:phage baseplate assembly protein V [Acidocella sp. MX-AZ02]EKN01120.1 phage P2 baseplate assembly gpV-like protein [Acidocella sp. MX-AZ02]